MVIRLGIIGFGWVARDYMLPAIDASPGVELRAVVSPRPEDFAGLPDSVATYAAAGEMAAREQLDAVYVASPNHLHRLHVELALAAGWHVLCEKPLAADIGEARRLVEAVTDHPDLVYRTAYDQRHHPAHAVMRDLIADGTLGRITQLRIDYACWLPAGWTTDNWRIDPTRAGGGATIDLAPHGLDLAEFLLDDTLAELTVYLQHATHDYGVDDGGVLAGRFAGDAVLAHTVGYNRPETLPRRRLEVIGTGGILLAENTMGQTAGGTLTHYDAATGEASAVSFAPTAPFFHQLTSFATAVRSPEGPAGNTAPDDLRLAVLLDDALAQNLQPSWP